MKEANTVSVEDVQEDLLSFIRSTILVDNAAISSDTLFSDLGIDSVAFLEILLYLERQFNVYIDDRDLTPENISSVRQLALTACKAVPG